MRSTLVVLLAIVLATPFAAASLYVDPLLTSQGLEPFYYDNDTHGDASDSCTSPFPALSYGVTTNGFMLPKDDPEDDYALDVAAADLGDTITVELRNSNAVPFVSVVGLGVGHDVLVWLPGGCTSVMAATQPGFITETVSFTASTAGRYTVQVLQGEPVSELPQSEETHAASAPLPAVLAPEPVYCHSICMSAVNAYAGYSLTVTKTS